MAETFGQRLKTRRGRHAMPDPDGTRKVPHMTQAELAAAIGASIHAIRAYEQGARLPDEDVRRELCTLWPDLIPNYL